VTDVVFHFCPFLCCSALSQEFHDEFLEKALSAFPPVRCQMLLGATKQDASLGVPEKNYIHEPCWKRNAQVTVLCLLVCYQPRDEKMECFCAQRRIF